MKVKTRRIPAAVSDTKLQVFHETFNEWAPGPRLAPGFQKTLCDGANTVFRWSLACVCKINVEYNENLFDLRVSSLCPGPGPVSL